MTVIIRSKGGSAEREEFVQVPDMWHLYLKLKQTAEAAGAIYDFEKGINYKWSDDTRPLQTIKVEMTLAGLAESAKMVYDCWMLAHDLHRTVAELQAETRV